MEAQQAAHAENLTKAHEEITQLQREARGSGLKSQQEEKQSEQQKAEPLKPASVFETPQFKSLVAAHQVFVDQSSSDLSQWQDLCAQLLSLFKLFSETDHKEVVEAIPQIGAKLEQINSRLDQISDPSQSQQFIELQKRHEKLLDVCRQQKEYINRNRNQ